MICHDDVSNCFMLKVSNQKSFFFHKENGENKVNKENPFNGGEKNVSLF